MESQGSTVVWLVGLGLLFSLVTNVLLFQIRQAKIRKGQQPPKSRG